MFLCPVTYVAPFNSVDRIEADLEGAIVEEQVDSVAEACKVHDVRLRGQIKTADGGELEIDEPVRDEKTFTADGLTRAVAPLFEYYTKYRALEQIESRDRGPLTEEELNLLKEAQEELQKAIQADRQHMEDRDA